MRMTRIEFEAIRNIVVEEYQYAIQDLKDQLDILEEDIVDVEERMIEINKMMDVVEMQSYEEVMRLCDDQGIDPDKIFLQ